MMVCDTELAGSHRFIGIRHMMVPFGCRNVAVVKWSLNVFMMSVVDVDFCDLSVRVEDGFDIEG